MCKRLVTVKFLILLLVASAGHVHSAGFAILYQGAGPMGQGNAFVAQADDPSALFFNPAGISQLEGSQAYLGSTIIVPRGIYNGPDHQERNLVFKKGDMAVSIGFNALRADIMLKKKLMLAPLPDGEQKLTGDT